MTIPALNNPQAALEARHLLDYLHGLPPGYILTGQHNFPATISQSYERVHALTGRYPALWGQDFGFAAYGDKDSIHAREAIIAEAIEQHKRGAIITLMWHTVRPTEDEPGVFQGSVMADISPQAYADLVTPGTAVHTRWLAQADRVAEHLKVLQRENIPVLWRPYHEMNGAWFWWGHKTGTRFVALWRQMYRRFTADHGLHNLIWVWNTNAPNHPGVLSYEALFPGHAYVDVLATDIYHGDYRQRYHDNLLRLAAGKPIAIGECAELPEALERQQAWRWFMAWADLLEPKNSVERIRRVYHAANAIHRDHPVYGWSAWRAAHSRKES